MQNQRNQNQRNSSKAASSLANDMMESDFGNAINEAYELELARDPIQVRIWLAYIDTLGKARDRVRYLMYERAVKAIPRSYKIWRKYLQERMRNLKKLPYILEEAYEEVNAVYRRALTHMNKFPRIWIDFLEFLISQKAITKVRKTLDNSIRTLPIHQHYRMWNVVIPWLRESYVRDIIKLSINFCEWIMEYAMK
jgi:pre-mRNA-splicing factor SYF1